MFRKLLYKALESLKAGVVVDTRSGPHDWWYLFKLIDIYRYLKILIDIDR